MTKKKKEKISEDLGEIKDNLKSDKLVFGTERTMKLFKNKKLSKVFVSLNTDEETMKDIIYYSGFVDTKIVKLDVRNDELGVFCKKPFFISVIGLMK